MDLFSSSSWVSIAVAFESVCYMLKCGFVLNRWIDGDNDDVDDDGDGDDSVVVVAMAAYGHFFGRRKEQHYRDDLE